MSFKIFIKFMNFQYCHIFIISHNFKFKNYFVVVNRLNYQAISAFQNCFSRMKKIFFSFLGFSNIICIERMIMMNLHI